MFKILLYLLMINPVVIGQKLTGLVGISPTQPYNPSYQVLDPANQKSRSGYYITDNPICKIENIFDTQDYSNIAIADFNNWLRLKLNTAAISIVNDVFNENDVIDEQLLYKNPINKISLQPTSPPVKNNDGNYVNVYQLPQGFNGYWIQVTHQKNVAFCIPRVLLEFNGTAGGPNGTVKLYLFNTADLSRPIFSQVCTVTGPLTEVLLPDLNGDLNGWICDNTLFGKGYKGDYYLGYFTSELTNGLLPFQRQYRDSIIMSSIDGLNILRVNFSAFTHIGKPFDLLNYSPFVVYNGVNPDIIVYEDFTNLVMQQQRLFARAIQLKAQIGFIEEIIQSIRSNKTERFASLNANKLTVDIEGEKGENNIKVTGLKPQLYGAIAKIRKEIAKLSVGETGAGMIKVQTLS